MTLMSCSQKNILIIDEGTDSQNHQGPHLNAKSLSGMIAILRLTDIETYFIKYLGITRFTSTACR